MTNPTPTYEIHLRGNLPERYRRWFEGLDIELLPNRDTRLIGHLDPAALHGILDRIRDLNLTIILLQQVTRDEAG